MTLERTKYKFKEYYLLKKANKNLLLNYLNVDDIKLQIKNL